MLLLPPARLSMITGWPRRSASFGPTARAITSAGPPAGKGTIQRTGFEGQAWAKAWPAASEVSSTVAAIEVFNLGITIDLSTASALGFVKIKFKNLLPPRRPGAVAIQDHEPAAEHAAQVREMRHARSRAGDPEEKLQHRKHHHECA